MKRFITIITFISLHFSVYGDAKDQDNFDSIYIHIATVMSLENMDSALISADSLLEVSSEDPIKKMRCFMLLGSLNAHKGDVIETLVLATKADKIATQENNKEWQMRIAGFLYSTFNDIGLPEHGKKYIKKVEQLNKSEKNPLIQTYIHQAKAKFYLGDSLPKETIKEVNNAEILIEELSRQKVGPLIEATSFQLQGLAYLQLEDPEKAKKYLIKAEEILPKNFSLLLGYIYLGLARVYLLENDENQAFFYLNNTEDIIQGSKDYSMKLIFYDTWKQCHLQMNNSVLAEKYDKKLLELKNERSIYLEEISNRLIHELNEDSEKKSKNYLMLISITFSLIILIIMILLYNREKKKVLEKEYENIVTDVKDLFEDK